MPELFQAHEKFNKNNGIITVFAKLNFNKLMLRSQVTPLNFSKFIVSNTIYPFSSERIASIRKSLSSMVASTQSADTMSIDKMLVKVTKFSFDDPTTLNQLKIL
mgnify:CR=1 FL=1